MAESSVTFIGRLGGDVDLKFLSGGNTAVANFSLAHTPRKKEGNEWVDAGPTTWLSVKCFKAVAEGAADSLGRGDEVVVVGKLRTEEWIDKDTGGKRSKIVLLADTVAKSVKPRGGSQSASTNDGWGALSEDEPPF